MGFDLIMTYRFVAKAQTDCAPLLGNNFEGKRLYVIILDFIVYFYVSHVEMSRTTLIIE